MTMDTTQRTDDYQYRVAMSLGDASRWDIGVWIPQSDGRVVLVSRGMWDWMEAQRN